MLQGVLPSDAWGALANGLQRLDLRDNELTGTVPAALGQLPQLVDLWMSLNQLNGDLEALLALPAIQTVLLAGNLFTGTIPASLPTSRVEMLDLGQNFLTGTIPTLWYNAPRLKRLAISGNRISGTIPTPSLAGLPAGRSVYDVLASSAAIRSTQNGVMDLLLDGNQLTGTVDPGIAMLPVATLRIGSNRLTGSLPATFLSMPYSRLIDADSNGFKGSLPNSVFSVQLKMLSVGQNELTGPIPTQLSKCADLYSLDLSNNDLSGTLPTEFTSLQQLASLSVAGNRRLQHGDQLNAQHENLPSWLSFDVSHGRSGQLQLMCYGVVANQTVMNNLLSMAVDPSYFAYQNCSCAVGYDWVNGTDGSVSCKAHVLGVLEGRNGWVLVAMPLILATALAMAATFAITRWRMPGKRWPASSKRAVQEHLVTLVLSDICALAELSTWNPTATRSALVIHDRVIRSLLSKYRGHELSAENGTFVLTFDEATDAVAWCLATQQALLDARWPYQLQLHEHTRGLTSALLGHLEAADDSPVLIGAVDDGAPRKSCCSKSSPVGDPPSGDESDGGMDDLGLRRKKRLQWDADLRVPSHDSIKAATRDSETLLFCGLRVRMCVVTGPQDKVARMALPKPTDQFSSLLKTAWAIAEASHGGQVMVEASTFSRINHRLTDIATAVPSAPRGRGEHVYGKRRASSMNVQMPEMPAEPALRTNSYDPIARAKSVESRKHSSFGLGDRVMSRVLSALLRHSLTSQGSANADADQPSNEGSREGVMVIDMGLHQLSDIAEPQQLHQIVVPGIQDRARHLPPLHSLRQLSPGYFDAPLAKESPLCASSYLPTKPVTLVFTLMEKLPQMKLENPNAAAVALALYRDCLRKMLVGRGIECQELDSSFMLVFHEVTAAIQFCILAQEALMAMPWGSAVLGLSSCRPTISETTHQVVFQGPRARMGIYEGIPTKVTPHSTTGRADYFGPLVNRCARICNASAQGGQILTSWEVVRKAIKRWAPDAVLQPPEEGQEPVLIPALYCMRNRETLSRVSGRGPLEPSTLVSALEAWQRASSVEAAVESQRHDATEDEQIRVVTSWLLPKDLAPLSPKAASMAVGPASGLASANGADSRSDGMAVASPDAVYVDLEQPSSSGAEGSNAHGGVHNAAGDMASTSAPQHSTPVHQPTGMSSPDMAPASPMAAWFSLRSDRLAARGIRSSLSDSTPAGRPKAKEALGLEGLRSPSNPDHFTSVDHSLGGGAVGIERDRRRSSINHLESSLYTLTIPGNPAIPARPSPAIHADADPLAGAVSIRSADLGLGIMRISEEQAQQRQQLEDGSRSNSGDLPVTTPTGQQPRAFDRGEERWQSQQGRNPWHDSLQADLQGEAASSSHGPDGHAKRASLDISRPTLAQLGAQHERSGDSRRHSIDMDAWRSITHLHIHHAGQFKVKGVTEPFTLMQINSERLAGRAFAATATGKAQLLEPPQGLKCTVVFEDNLEHMRAIMGEDEDSDNDLQE